jgi:Putative metallopeptidase
MRGQGRAFASAPILRAGRVSISRLSCGLVLLFVLLCVGDEAFAQPNLSEPAKSPELSAFQTRVDAAALAVRDSDPRFKGLSPIAAQGLVEFVSGNMLFVLLHELGHAVITQMGLPVLGRMEDAADTFAVFMLLRMGSEFSHRALVDAAEGWFFAARRDRKTGQRVAYYSEHGLNEQRAYQIVCIMVGSDAEKFRDLADETNLPEDRRHTCLGDYSNAMFSWNLLLEPHRRAPDQPKTKIDVIYGPAEDGLASIRDMARTIMLLETVAAHAADQLVWPAPLSLEMQACGFPNASWEIRTRQVILCYELGADFGELYREFGNAH